MFEVREPKDLKVSGARNKMMDTIDSIIPEFNKVFVLERTDTLKCSVMCNMIDDKGSEVVSFTSIGRSFTDALKHIRRQIQYYDKYNENYYAGESLV